MSKYDDLLKKDPWTFDQDEENGWRALDNNGKYLEAAKLIEKYLAANLEEVKKFKKYPNMDKLMFFHAGQLYATEGTEYYQEAIKQFKKAYRGDREDWNIYINATIAFLNADQNELRKQLKQLNILEESGIQTNASVVQRLLDGLQAGNPSYKDAY